MLREEWIGVMEALPENLRAAVDGLSELQLDTRYRPGGWTVRQVVHHLPDSHVNSYVRFRLALTEDQPIIKTYEEAKWAELLDARQSPIEPSLHILEGLHRRFVALLRSLAFQRLRQDVPTSRTGRNPPGLDARPLRLALPPSRRPYQ